MARLKQHYLDKVVPELTSKFGYKTPMEVPRITKITLNMGVSEAVADKKVMDHAVSDLTKIPRPNRSFFRSTPNNAISHLSNP